MFGSFLANRYLPAFYARLPETVSAKIPFSDLTQFNNPQLLVQPGASAIYNQLLASHGQHGAELLPAIQLAARQGLAAAICEVFMISAGLLVLASALTFLVKDVPLRKTNAPGVGADNSTLGDL